MKTDRDILPNESNKEFFSVKDVAEIFSCSPSTVKNWIRDGKIESITFGTNLIRIPRREVVRFGKGRRGE